VFDLTAIVSLPNLPSPRWIITRNGGTDLNGEWIAGSSWTARKNLSPMGPLNTPTPHLVLDIYGTRDRPRGMKLRPARWSLHLEWGSARHDFGERGRWRSCRSIVDAWKKADHLFETSSAWVDFRREVYSPRDAECVFRKTDEGWTPFLTRLGMGFNPWDALMTPFGRVLSPFHGEFALIDWFRPLEGPGRWHARHMQISMYGYSCGPFPVPCDGKVSAAARRVLEVEQERAFLTAHPPWLLPPAG
jgi:hypothetical protein